MIIIYILELKLIINNINIYFQSLNFIITNFPPIKNLIYLTPHHLLHLNLFHSLLNFPHQVLHFALLISTNLATFILLFAHLKEFPLLSVD